MTPLDMLFQQLFRNKSFPAIHNGTLSQFFPRVQPPMDDEALCLGEVETTRLARVDLGWNAKMVNVWPFLL